MRELMETRFWRASRVTGKSLAETAETPCKYFARETVRSFTVSLWGAVQTPVRNAIPNLRQMCPRRSGFAGEEVLAAAAEADLVVQDQAILFDRRQRAVLELVDIGRARPQLERFQPVGCRPCRDLIDQVEIVFVHAGKGGAVGGIDGVVAQGGRSGEEEAGKRDAGEIVDHPDLPGALAGPVEILGDLLGVADPLTVGRLVLRGAAGLGEHAPQRRRPPDQIHPSAGGEGAERLAGQQVQPVAALDHDCPPSRTRNASVMGNPRTKSL